LAKSLTIKQFLGINNVLPADKLIFPSKDERGVFESFQQVASNVYVDDALKLRTRPGSTRVQSGPVHSVWSDGAICLFRQGDSLKRYFGPTTVTTLRSGMAGSNRMAYLSLNGNVYYSDGVHTGIIGYAGFDRTWGMQPPQSFVLGATFGSLQEGRYLVTLTYIRDDGQESGTSPVKVIELTENQGIAITGLTTPSDASITAIMVYVSTVNGMVLYRAGVTSVAASGISIASRDIISNLSNELRTQGLDKPPPGSILSQYKGRILVAQGNILFRSEPLSYELFDYLNGYNIFDAPIQVVGPVDDGVFLGTTKQVLFLNGHDPDKWRPIVVAEYGAVFGTLSTLNLETVKGEGQGKGVMFTTTQGMCLGVDGGKFKNLTKEAFVMQPASYGSGLYRQERGANQYLALVKQANDSIISGTLPVFTGSVLTYHDSRISGSLPVWAGSITTS
jgi:hypothetical protein